MIPTLFPFQDSCIDRTATAAQRNARIIIIQAATGAGKSTIGSAIIKRAVAKHRKVLEIVHRRKLVDQFSQRLVDFEVDHGVIMRGEPLDLGASVQVASKDTLLSRCMNNNWMALPPADLVIVDEGRHAAIGRYKEMIDHYRNNGALILLLDATPVLPDGRGLGPWADAIVCAAPVTELIAGGYLTPVKCYAPDRKKHKNGRAKRGIAGDLVESWKQYSLEMPTVLFCSRVQHSKDAVDEFNRAGIPFMHIDADTHDDDRDEAFGRLADGSLKGVSNVGIIGEGVDIPCLGCVDFWMDPESRTRFLQGCGRIMRKYTGSLYTKTHGVLIDHAGAVFRHGFPDEDTEWTLEGNVDEKFAAKHKDGKTEQALYCSHCELMYHGDKGCPQCGRMPTKPPRSIFAPPPMDGTNELLTEADRNGTNHNWYREEKIKHWMRCLAVSARRGGDFCMASVIYKRKYMEWPEQGFPCNPQDWHEKRQKIADVYPNFVKGRKAS